jgi:hypothetical protein
LTISVLIDSNKVMLNYRPIHLKFPINFYAAYCDMGSTSSTLEEHLRKLVQEVIDLPKAKTSLITSPLSLFTNPVQTNRLNIR